MGSQHVFILKDMYVYFSDLDIPSKCAIPFSTWNLKFRTSATGQIISAVFSAHVCEVFAQNFCSCKR